MEDLIIKYLPKLTHLDQKTDNYGVIIDTETTGIEVDAELLEFTALRFYFDNDLKIVGYDEPVSMLNEPSIPITPEAERITGISLDMVKGHTISKGDVEALLDGAAIVVAHNARFDRNVLERNLGIKKYYWGCSQNDINWMDQDISSRSQEFIAFKYGFWYKAHRSEEDCISLLSILEKRDNFNVLFNEAFTETNTVVYQDTPFATKDFLKEGGCRWDGEGKFWYKERVKNLDDLKEMESKVVKFNREVYPEDFLNRYKS